MSWKEVEIGNLVELRQGLCINKKSNHLVADTGLPLLRITDMINNKRSVFIKEEVPEKYIAKHDDIIYSRTGQVGLVFRHQFGVLFNNCFTVTLISEELTRDYLYWFLRCDDTKKTANDYASGAAQLDLSHSAFKCIKIKYPIQLPIQRKIASILSAYDDLIENNLKRIKLLEEKAQLHYKEMMQETSSSKHKQEEYLKDCLSFYIGGGWGEEEYKEGFTNPAFVIRGTDIPAVKKGEVKGVPFRYHKESNLATRNMQAGDIVFEVSGGSKGQPIGRSILITEKMLQQFGKSVICASFCKMLRPNKNVTPEFFYLYLLASHENGIIAQYEKHSASNIVNYGFEEFIGEQKISFPKENELKEFSEKVKRIFTLISILGEQNTKLREARDILLPKLMNGQIEV